MQTAAKIGGDVAEASSDRAALIESLKSENTALSEENSALSSSVAAVKTRILQLKSDLQADGVASNPWGVRRVKTTFEAPGQRQPAQEVREQRRAKLAPEEEVEPPRKKTVQIAADTADDEVVEVPPPAPAEAWAEPEAAAEVDATAAAEADATASGPRDSRRMAPKRTCFQEMTADNLKALVELDADLVDLSKETWSVARKRFSTGGSEAWNIWGNEALNEVRGRTHSSQLDYTIVEMKDYYRLVLYERISRKMVLERMNLIKKEEPVAPAKAAAVDYLTDFMDDDDDFCICGSI